MNENEPVKSNSSEPGASASTGVNRKDNPTRVKRNVIPGLLGTICFLFSAAAFCFAGMIWWQQKQVIDHLSYEQTTLKDQSTVLENLLNENAFALKNLEQENKALKDENSSNTQQLVNLDNKIQQLQTNDRQAWKISEAEYLLRAANLRLHTERNIAGAMYLLKLAKNTLDDLHDPDLFLIKKSLEEDIAALHNVTTVDTTGLWLQLNAIVTQIHTLPLLPENGFDTHVNLIKEEAKNNTQTVAGGETSKVVTLADRIKKMFLDSWRFFSDQFYFHKNNTEEISFIVSPKEEVRLKENMSLMLMQAQQALLIGDKAIYQQSLGNVIKSLIKWFHDNETGAKSVLSHLEALRAIDIVPDLPVINRALKTLKTCKIQTKIQSHADDGSRDITTNKPPTEMVPQKDSVISSGNNQKQHDDNDTKMKDETDNLQDAFNTQFQEAVADNKMDEAGAP